MERWAERYNNSDIMDLGVYGSFMKAKVITVGTKNGDIPLYVYKDHDIGEIDPYAELLLCAKTKDNEDMAVYYVARTDEQMIHNFIHNLDCTFRDASSRPYYKAVYYKKEEKWECKRIKHIPDNLINKIQESIGRECIHLD